MAKHHQRHQRQPARAARTRARRLTTGGACGQVASRPRFYSSTITDDSGGGSLGRASPTKSRRTRPNKNSLLLRDEQTKLVPASPFIFVVFYNKKARAGKRTAFCAIWEPEGACGGPIGTPTSPFERDQKNRGFDTPGAPRVEARLTVH